MKPAHAQGLGWGDAPPCQSLQVPNTYFQIMCTKPEATGRVEQFSTPQQTPPASGFVVRRCRGRRPRPSRTCHVISYRIASLWSQTRQWILAPLPEAPHFGLIPLLQRSNLSLWREGLRGAKLAEMLHLNYRTRPGDAIAGTGRELRRARICRLTVAQNGGNCSAAMQCTGARPRCSRLCWRRAPAR
ncbi:hypothetical protein RA210_U10575 [Rubrivivax sp. A210]|nr:hypothetical protein RA210_U10575 [Rubrivivax sp. A210]